MGPSIVKARAGKARRMSEHAPDPGEQIEREAAQLEEELDRLEEHLDKAKDRLKERREDAVGPGEAEEAAEGG
jgi:predicted nuclease with TOPRIM domain